MVSSTTMTIGESIVTEQNGKYRTENSQSTQRDTVMPLKDTNGSVTIVSSIANVAGRGSENQSSSIPPSHPPALGTYRQTYPSTVSTTTSTQHKMNPSHQPYRFHTPSYVFNSEQSNHLEQLKGSAGCTCKKSR
jgi:hypothetical protein